MSRRPEYRSRPRVNWIPKAATTHDAEDACFFAASYNLVPDDWQTPIVHGWLGRRKDGKYAASTCGLAVPRQNGKNGVIEIRELFGMVVLGEAFLHTAHELKTSRKAWRRLKYFFGEKPNDPNARFPELNALLLEVRSTNSQEAIFLHDVCVNCDEPAPRCQCGRKKLRPGGSVEFVARSKGSGRGFTVDVLVLDEAQHLTDEQLEAIRSSMSSGRLGNSQVIYTGTPPNRDKGEDGEVFARIRRGANKNPRLCWIEYGAPDGPLPDLDDQRLLYEVNPSLGLKHANGAFGLQVDVIAGERDEFSPDGYARERLGWWGDPNTKHQSVINMQAWANLKVRVPAPDRATLVLDVALDLAWTSIGAASSGRSDDETLVLLHHAAGTSWVVNKVDDMQVNLEIVELALTPTAKLFGPDLTKLGIEFKQLTETEVGVGCNWFQERIKTAGIVHTGQPELDAAVKNARTRYVGKIQHWDARDPRVDNSPLVATSVAAQRWAQLTSVKPKAPPPAPRRTRRSPARRPSGSDVSSMGF